MKAFLLAAGLGSRLRPITDVTPKCMLAIGGRPLLDIWLEAFDRAGVDEVLVNLHHLPDVVSRHLATHEGPPAVRTVYEPEMLGSAGTLAAHREVRESARTGQRPQHPPDWGRMHNALWQRAVSERRRIAGAGAEAADADVTSAVNHLGQLLEHAPWFEADARLRAAATAETVRYAMLGETVPSLRAQQAWAAYWDAHLSGAGQASPIESIDARRPLLDYWLAAWDAWTATA